MKWHGNRGETGFAIRRSTANPMGAFDRLPPDLRAWLRDAALPWSPRSCLTIWEKARREGLDHRAALARLDAIEKAMLTRRYPGAENSHRYTQENYT